MSQQQQEQQMSSQVTTTQRLSSRGPSPTSTQFHTQGDPRMAMQTQSQLTPTQQVHYPQSQSNDPYSMGYGHMGYGPMGVGSKIAMLSMPRGMGNQIGMTRAAMGMRMGSSMDMRFGQSAHLHNVSVQGSEVSCFVCFVSFVCF